jgi:sigma-B regulation protein RsbU (phosphoserine phosphatase)
MSTFTTPEGQLSDLTVGMMERYASSGNILDSLSWCLPQILRQIHAEAGSLFLIQPNQQDLACVVCDGPVDITGIKVNMGSGLVGQSFRDRRGLLIEDAQQHGVHNHSVDKKSGFVTKSILTVPVVFGDKCFGCLQAINRLDASGGIASFSQEHLKVFEKLAVVLAVALQNVDLATELVKDALLKKDLKSAEEVQSSLFPHFETLSFIVGQVIPARNLSGDFLDFVQADGKVIFCQGDVAGKGIPAALTVARCLALFRYLAKKDKSVVEIARSINTEIYDAMSHDSLNAGFVTFFIGSYQPVSGDIEFINCGHGEVLLLQHDQPTQVLSGSLPPLGVIESEALTFECQVANVRHGRLCIFTDGVTEARMNGKELGLSGTQALLHAVVQLSIRDALQKIMGLFHSQRLITSDDATLMIVGK